VDAEADAALVVEAADREASELLATARRDGRVAGERVRASELAFARRQAREMILQAQRRAFEALRVAAHGELVRQAPSDRGQELTRLIDRSVRERVGSPVVTHPEELGPLGAQAEHQRRRAALGTLALIDAELERMPHAIEALWT
jgi:vacuolar-type H+-ATPase subunit E/Vma4